jgi:hypothetical protein
MASNADFTLDGDPFANLGFDTTAAASVAMQLEDSPALDVRSTNFRVVAKSISAGTIAELGDPGDAGASPSPNPQSALSITMPSGHGSWLVQCQVNGGKNARGETVAEFTKQRIIAVRFGPGLREIVPPESTQYDATHGWSEAINGALGLLTSAGFANRSQAGIAGRQENVNDTLTTKGGIILKLGTAGLPAAGRTLELEALLSTTDAGNATRADFFNLTTSQVVGSVLTSASLTPARVTLDVTGEVGSSLLDDTVNIISVRLAQTSTDAAQRALCDLARVNVDYI